MLAVFVLILANAFFVATEFAIVAIRRSRLEQLVAEGSRSALTAKEIVGHLDAYIAACQFGITIASLSLGWIGEPALAHLLEPPLERVFGVLAPAASHTIAVGVAFAIITALHIVIGELAPKGLALQRTESTVLFIAIPVKIFYVIFKLPISLLNVVGNGVLRLLGLRPASEQEMVHSVSELRYLMGSMEEAGVLGRAESNIASRAFNFGESTAGAVMTPRVRLEALPVTSSLADIQEWARNSVHRRLLIYQDSLDRIIGLIHIGDIFKASVQPREEFNIRTLLRPVSIVSRGLRADTLLEELRSTRQHLVVVSDTYGGTAGIVTLEDLIGVLVGRFEEEVGPTEQGHSAMVYSLDDHAVVLDGLMPVEEVGDLLGVPLKRSGSIRTLGGLVIQLMNRIPEVGDAVILAGYSLQVEVMDKRRVASVRVSKTARNPHLTIGGSDARGT